MTIRSTTISVNAYGVSDGGYPVMTIFVDGSPIAQQTVTGSLDTYSFTANLDPSVAHDIKIGFYNTNGQRSLQVQSVSVGGTVMQATDPRETYTSRVGTVSGSGNLAYGGVADFSFPAGSLQASSTTSGATTTTTTTPPTTTPPATTPPATSSSTATTPTTTPAPTTSTPVAATSAWAAPARRSMSSTSLPMGSPTATVAFRR